VLGLEGMKNRNFIPDFKSKKNLFATKSSFNRILLQTRALIPNVAHQLFLEIRWVTYQNSEARDWLERNQKKHNPCFQQSTKILTLATPQPVNTFSLHLSEMLNFETELLVLC